MLAGSCQRVYWFRNRVNSKGAKSKSVHITVVNHSKEYLSPQFEKELKKICRKQLSRQNFYETPKEKHDLDFIINVRVDSFSIKKEIKFWDDYRTYKNARLLQLTLNPELKFYPTQVSYWDAVTGIYYFGIEKRDLKRSRSILKYEIRHIRPFE